MAEETEIKQVATLTREQRELLDRLTGFVGTQLGRGLKLPSGVGVIPGLTDLQQSGLSRASSFGEGTAGRSRDQAIQGLLGFGDTAASSFDEAVLAPTVRQFNTEIVPGLAERFAGTGATGALSRELGTAGRDLGTNIAAQRGLFLASDRDRALQALQSGVGLSAANELLPIQTRLSAGGIERGVGVEQASGDLNRFLLQHPAFNPALGLLSPALGTQAFQNFAVPKKNKSQEVGTLAGTVGGGLLGFAVGGPGGALLGSQLGGGLGGSIGGLL